MCAEHPIPSWTMEDLYESMKDALRFFKLGFHEKSEVTVTIVGDKVWFSYQDRVISLNIGH
jgi:hypothetical protein